MFISSYLNRKKSKRFDWLERKHVSEVKHPRLVETEIGINRRVRNRKESHSYVTSQRDNEETIGTV